MNAILHRRNRVLPIAAAVFAFIAFVDCAHADIFQWEYINPANPSQGKRQSTTLAPDGAGVDAVPGANLIDRNLTMAYLTGADLTGATGQSAILTSADLSQANLSNADLYGATLTGADFTGAQVRGARLTSFAAVQLYSTASYQAHDLTGIAFAVSDLSEWNFAGQNLTNAVFRFDTLTNAQFTDANLTNAVFFADLTDADFTDAEIRGAGFLQDARCPGSLVCQTVLTLPQLYSTASYQERDIRGVSGIDLSVAATTAIIMPDGHIDRLALNDDELLIVRDYDGHPEYGTAYPPIPIAVDEHLAMDPGGTLRMVFEADAWDSTISFAPGIPVTLGGTLELTFADDVNLPGQVGRTFDLFDWTGVTPTGAFAIASPYAWDLSNLYTTGQVTLTVIPEPATIALVAIGLFGLVVRAHRPQPNHGTGGHRGRGEFLPQIFADEHRYRVDTEPKHLRQSAPSVDRCLVPSSAASVTCFPRMVLTIRTILSIATAVFVFTSPAHADIFQWEYINPADPSQGKRQSTTLTPEGADLDAIPGANLSFRNLTMAYLIGEDLVDASVENTNLTNADFSQANLTNAVLSYSDFTHARFNQANLTNVQANYAKFTSVDLSQANLSSARFDYATLSDATFTGAEIRGASFKKDAGTGVTPAQLYSTASYQTRDLTGIGLNGNDLAGGNFVGQNLSSASFVYASMTGADFRQANLANANFYDATLTDADFTGAEVRGASFDKYNGTGITLAQLYSTASYQAHDLGGISLSRNDLIGGNFAGQNLTEAHIGEANLSGANFRQANLTNATIWSVTLTGADFTGAEVRGASFYRDPSNRNSEISLAQLYSTASYQAHDLSGIGLDLSDLTGANFAGQNLTNARIGGTLTGADFTNADIRAATISPYYDSNTSMYVGGITPAQLYTTASYKAHDLSGINLYGHNLTAGNFAGQNLTKANLSGVLTGASFRQANLTDATIGGTLTDADFTDAEVRGATLGGISSAQLYSTASYQAHDLTGIRLYGDLSGWNFAGQNLTKAHFDSATLTGADLSETTLTNATFTYAKLSDADLTSAEVHGASFAAANLTRASFRQVNLANVDIRGATLTDADFTGAEVRGANFVNYFVQCARSCYGTIFGTGITLSQLYSTASYQAHDLSGIRLPRNYLAGANFAGQNLTNSDFTSATLTGADFTGAEVRGASLGYTGITLAQLISTASYAAGDMSGIQLWGIQLSGGNFAGQNLTDANLGGANLTGANFRQANLTNAFLSSTLTDADFTDADVRGAEFDPRYFGGTTITLAQLYSTASYKAHDLSGIGLGFNNLAGGNFAEQDLSNADFRGANLTGASFRQANLTNANFAYPSCFVGGDLNGIGGGAGAPGGCGYFGYATLTDADLSSADARGAFLDFSEATITNLIRPNGHINGLDVEFGELLVVRDYDGDPNNEDVYGNPIPNPVPIPPIPITIDQHLTIGPGGTLRMVFEADEWDSTISFAPGIPVALGGTLELTFADDVNLPGQVGRTFDLFDWTGVNPIGAFAVSSPYAWDLSSLYTTGEVTLTSVPEPNSLILIAMITVALATRRGRVRVAALVFSIVVCGSAARADIYQWEVGSNGAIQPATLAPDGAGVDAVPGADLSQRNLTRALLRAADLAGAHAHGVNLTDAYLAGTNLTNADLTGANLTDAYCFGATWTNATLTNAVVRGSRLTTFQRNRNGIGITLQQFYSTASYQARDLTGIRLGGNDLSGGNFAGQDLTGASFFDDYLVTVTADLSDADFTNANLTGTNFFFAVVSGANFTRAEVRGANFSSTGITSAQLYSTASYQARNLNNIGLDYNSLDGWNFAGQNLTNASFYKATLTDADFTGAIIRGARFVREWVQQGRPGVGTYHGTGISLAQLYSTASYQAHDLSGCTFWNNDLAGVNFAGQNLANADFRGAWLTSADISAADARGALGLDLSNAVVTNLIFPDGRIKGLDLSAEGLLVIRDYDGNFRYSPPLPIPISVDEHLSMGPSGTLRMEFEADAWDSTISFAAGIPVALGGTLELTFANDVNLASQVGRTLDLFDWTGVKTTGAFAVSSLYAWDLTNLYTTGDVTLISIPEPTSMALAAAGAVGFAFHRKRKIT